MADLDFFKQVNDAYGHVAGDNVLRLAARRMHATVRQYDSVGRYSGEEFLAVLPGCDLRGAFTHAERLRVALAAERNALPEAALPVTCSLGISSADCSEPADADRLLREADAALYLAKRNGRNRVEPFRPDLAPEEVPEPLVVQNSASR
jgi:two-component system cell cycle response regulator